MNDYLPIMQKFFLSTLILLLSLISLSSIAQTNIGDYESGFKKQGNNVFFSNTNADVKLEFCTPEMVRIRTSWERKFQENEPWMVVNYTFPEVKTETTESAKGFEVKTSKLILKINKAPFKIDIYTIDGKLLSSEASGKTGTVKNGETVTCIKKLNENEHFFGFGERMDFLDQKNKKVKLNVGRGKGRPHIQGAYNVLEANYSPVPFFMSTSGYGIFFHTAYPSEWDMASSNPEQYSFGAAGGELDYYFIYGPSFPSILDNYTNLTGKAPLMPMFALGLHVGTYSGGTWGYEQLTSDQYVIDLARKFRTLGIPVDILHLDSTWRIFGKNGGKGATTFEWRETFKNPKGMFDSLYAMNYKMVGLHLRPRFDNGNKLNLLDQAQAKGYTYPEENSPGEFVNFFDEKAVNWWWENGVKTVADQGAKFLKTDEGSAFGGLANESEKVGPTGKDALWMHNIFPLVYAKAPYEKFQEYNGIRGMNQTREGYAGIQKYPFIFAGDWPSEWQYFEPVIKAGLNIGISGVGNWAHCMGGFEHIADPELYIRWCQFGLMSPVAHLFGMEHPNYKEPWNYGEDALKIFTKYDKLRYRLIPYLYSHSYQMYTTGMPMMRALVLHYQNDENVYNITDQYLLGENLMVCPVTTKGAQTRVVYLPEGVWFDYYTGKRYEGKQYIPVLTPLDQIPIFAKGGAIIPMQPEMNYTGEKPIDPITLEIFPEGASLFSLYEDDGKSLNYQDGAFAITKINTSLSATSFTLRINKPEGKFKPSKHSYLAKIHWNDKQPDSILEKGKKLSLVHSFDQLQNQPGWFLDPKEKILWIKSNKENNENIELSVIF